MMTGCSCLLQVVEVDYAEQVFGYCGTHHLQSDYPRSSQPYKQLVEGRLDFRADYADLDSARMYSDWWHIGHTGLAVGAEGAVLPHHIQGKSAALRQGT